MGLYDGIIKDEQIKTSSDRNPTTNGRYIRLNTPQTEEHSGGWVAGELDGNQFVQVCSDLTLVSMGLKYHDEVITCIANILYSYVLRR